MNSKTLSSGWDKSLVERLVDKFNKIKEERGLTGELSNEDVVNIITYAAYYVGVEDGENKALQGAAGLYRESQNLHG
jgi:hypothetical protein